MERQATSLQSVGLHQATKEKEKVEKQKLGVFKKLEKKIGTTKDNRVRPRHRQEQHPQQRELSK